MAHPWIGVIEFVKVVEEGSFSAAARSLQVSKSHVSKQVRALEERLGVTLLHRTTRRLNLTSQGMDFFLRCQKILQNLDEAGAALAEELRTPRGPIRLTAAGAFGEDILAPLLAEFLTLHPGVTIEVSFTNRLVDIQEEHFDLAIRTGPTDGGYDDRHLAMDRLFGYRLVTAAAPAYLKRCGRPRTPAELEDHNCLVGTLPYWRFRKKGVVKDHIVRGNWRSNNGRALVRAAEAGLGIVQLPEFYLAATENAPLEPLLEAYALDEVVIWAMYPRRLYLPLRVSLLLEFLKEKLSP